MADRLQVTELDFDQIKNNLKSFLKQQSEFTDYDFEGAGLNVLIDILAYNTHYNAYYLNMVANESFLDTALLRDSVVSHAKTLGYTPYSTKSPKAIINLTVETNSTQTDTLTIPKGYNFISNLIDIQTYNFTVLEDVTVTKANTQFVFENLEIYEGQLNTYNFNYDESSNPKAVFELPDENIDTTTIQVTVTPASSNNLATVYTEVTDILDITATSESYFLRQGINTNNNYEIYFGDNVVGKKLEDGSIVSVSYLVTNGTAANKANGFTPSTTIGGFGTISVEVIQVASGGAARETVDSIKFSAASQFATQNRLVTFKDYESYILTNYPNIDSISVWGGEDNVPKVYGKIFISLNPKQNYFISETEKQRIIDEIITPKSIIAVVPEIVEPEYLYIILENEVQYNAKKTVSSEDSIKTAIRSTIINYKNTFLNKFSAKLVQSKIEQEIDSVDLNSIIGSKSTIRLQKRFNPTLNSLSSYTINFNTKLSRGTVTNRLSSTSFDINDSSGTRRTVIFDEVPQSSTGISSISVTNPGFNYTSAPKVTITGDGISATATAVIVNGRVQRIDIVNRGIDYTRAVVTLSGGGGTGATAAANIDAKIGTLRTIYYDTNAQRQIVNNNIGEINYDTGEITINDIRILSVNSIDKLIRLTIEAEEGIVESVRNTIITIDESDPTAIVTVLTKD